MDKINVFDDLDICARVIDSMNNSVLKGNVTFVVRNEVYVVPVVEGYANLTVCIKNASNNTVYAYYNDYDYNASECIKNIFVNKSNISLSCYYSHEDLFNCTIVNVVASEYFNSTVYLIVNNHTYPVSIVEGNGFIQLPGYLNFTTAYVEFEGNHNFNQYNTTEIIFKNSIEHEIYNTYDVELFYKNGTRFVIALMSNGMPIIGKQVIISINGASYTRITDDEGQASIALNLNCGVYNVTTYYLDENNITVIIDNIITIYSTIISQNLVKMYRNASQFKATFLDGQGHPLQNTTVTFNINGVMYHRLTNDNGTAKLNINLQPGEYIITSTNPLNGEMASNIIIVLSKIIENHDLIKYYRNASQFIVKILDDFGNPVGAGENVTFNINGVFYTRQTNSSGHTQLNINLSPGNYIITAEYSGCIISNKITVLPILYANDLIKSYGTPDQFIATLVDGQGNAYANQTITFNINGVFYNRTTDKNGVARLNINLLPGQYIITSMYKQSVIANIIKITS